VYVLFHCYGSPPVAIHVAVFTPGRSDAMGFGKKSLLLTGIAVSRLAVADGIHCVVCRRNGDDQEPKAQAYICSIQLESR
jgi:hypothetical protein